MCHFVGLPVLSPCFCYRFFVRQRSLANFQRLAAEPHFSDVPRRFAASFMPPYELKYRTQLDVCYQDGFEDQTWFGPATLNRTSPGSPFQFQTQDKTPTRNPTAHTATGLPPTALTCAPAPPRAPCHILCAFYIPSMYSCIYLCHYASPPSCLHRNKHTCLYYYCIMYFFTYFFIVYA